MPQPRPSLRSMLPPHSPSPRQPPWPLLPVQRFEPLLAAQGTLTHLHLPCVAPVHLASPLWRGMEVSVSDDQHISSSAWLSSLDCSLHQQLHNLVWVDRLQVMQISCRSHQLVFRMYSRATGECPYQPLRGRLFHLGLANRPVLQRDGWQQNLLLAASRYGWTMPPLSECVVRADGAAAMMPLLRLQDTQRIVCKMMPWRPQRIAAPLLLWACIHHM